jgi:DNA-binding transcriptional regulator LsrR (DeoR family)|tara:strand:+ start:2803 stop:3177 length:375 start_codon:yes stop_codon:yes gene_type:complete
MVEKTTTLGVASGTTVGPAVPANTMVISSGIEFVTAAGSAGTSATVAVGDGVTANLAAVSMQAKAAGTILGGVVPSFVSADDTIDAVLAVSGSGLVAATVRIWAVVVDCNENTKDAAEVARDLV